MSHVHSIFIVYNNIPENDKWIKDWPKIQGFYTYSDNISSKVWIKIQQYHRNSTKEVDSWLMCTQLIKDILRQTKYEENTPKKIFIQFCHRKLHIDGDELNEFEHTYHQHTPIWWYIKDGFLSQIINRAFQSQDIPTIVKMSFFLQDLDRQIRTIYKPPSHQSIILYRGQGLSHAHFEQLRLIQGGLLSFHTFLSATADKEIAMSCADSFRDHNPSLISILFRLDILPNTHTSTSFVSLDDKSSWSESKDECLFTMGAMFRIGQMKQLEDQLWQVELTLANDDDEDLQLLTTYIRQMTQDSTGWDQLVRLLVELKHFDKAEEVLDLPSDNSVRNDADNLVHGYQLMAWIKKKRREHKKAILFYHKALKTCQTSTNVNDIDVATIYNDLGSLKYNTFTLTVKVKVKTLSTLTLFKVKVF
ncbi:unnamed protein product [Adineta steineri]|uniref:Uncharacterized protein n=1 Tax=Adineta steineri TaxID=433720 RepID=A0A814RER4_9BILA|nr:unnamed protein product [Adineta steineri]CAF1201292.1 unnamed protein product [Adineta steineri]